MNKQNRFIHRIDTGIQTGKTDLLVHLAAGYQADGRPVLFLFPNEAYARFAEKRYGHLLPGVVFSNISPAAVRGRWGLSGRQYCAVLIDDADRHPLIEYAEDVGLKATRDPLPYVVSLFEEVDRPMSFIAAYSGIYRAEVVV